MHRSRVVLLTRLATVATGATLVLAGCDGGGTDDSGRYPHETGARCATEADSPADCEAAEDLAEEVEALAGVDTVDYEFRSIDGEGINELILVIHASDEATAEQVAAALELGLAEIGEVDGDRDESIAATRAGVSIHVDTAEQTHLADAAGLLVAAGGLAEHGSVSLNDAGSDVWVNMPPEATYADIGPVADDVAASDIPAWADVLISGGGGYLSGRGLDAEDAERWDALVAAAGPAVATLSVSDREVTVTIDGPTDIRPRDFTFETYGDRWWPMIRAHLDLVRAMGDGAAYVIDTNWEQSDAGFDTILDVTVGRTHGGADPRGWTEAAADYLER